MDLSVVIVTLNGRQALPATLASIAETAPEAEVIVANGPSADGTSGYVCTHEVVDELLDLADRNPTVARNAGLQAASGEVVAFLGQGSRLEPTWLSGVENALETGVDAVTGPIHRALEGDVTTESLEETTVGSRTVRFFDPGNVIFDRAAIEALDGFDEALAVGAARDVAHRLAGTGRTLRWEPNAAVLREAGPKSPQHAGREDIAREARAKGYRLAKNYGLDPGAAETLLRTVLQHGGQDVKGSFTGKRKPSEVLRNGREAARGMVKGITDGLRARRADRLPRRNPNGLSAGTSRASSRCKP